MKFLARLGQVMLQIVGIASGLQPILNPLVQNHPKAEDAVNKVVSEIGAIGGVVSTVEAIIASAMGATGNGATKLKAAVPFVAQIIQQSELMVGKKIHDEAAFTASVTAITSGFADLLNSLEGK